MTIEELLPYELLMAKEPQEDIVTGYELFVKGGITTEGGFNVQILPCLALAYAAHGVILP